MKTLKVFTLLFVVVLSCSNVLSQNETTKWYFGYSAALDFMSTPPSTLAASTMSSYEGSASIADANGNLLFYTDGGTIWNKNNLVMANGTGLVGSMSVTQGDLILKKPNSQNIYYVFTIAQGGALAFRYSIVDMSLASGNGSVTVKNATLLAQPVTEKITGTYHCNGVDIWIVVHEYGTDLFRSFLLTSAGISTTVVTSTIGTAHLAVKGQMKICANGNKLGITVYNGPGTNTPGGYELFDFNNVTGAVTNSLSLSTTFFAPWGVEFSPDGSKFYGTSGAPGGIFQWDLCAGTNTGIVSSAINISNGGATSDLQLAPDGKIYSANYTQNNIGVINSPNLLGLSSNYVANGISLSPAQSSYGLPNFIATMVKAPFSYSPTASCLTTSFSSMSYTGSMCSIVGPIVLHEQWNFGDPGSGALNTSTLSSISHTYPGVGNYTVTLIRYTACGTDTIRRPVLIAGPTPTIQSSAILCNGFARASISSQNTYGPYTYTWVPSGQTSSTVVNLIPGTYSVTIQGNIPGCVRTVTALVAPSVSINLLGATGSNNYCDPQYDNIGANFSGGSSYHSYLWSPGGYTTQIVNAPAVGIYTVTMTDNVYNCSVTKTIQVVQWSTPTIAVTGNMTVCAGNSTTLQITGANTYTWTQEVISGTVSYLLYGPYTSSVVITPTANHTYYYATGANTFVISSPPGYADCPSYISLTITSIPNPTINVSGNYSICSGETSTINASGASTYNWVGYSTNSGIIVSPSVSTIYTVVGTSAPPNSCSTTQSATVSVRPCTGLTDYSNTGFNLIIYPNPSDESINVSWDQLNTITSLDPTGSALIEIIDGLGRRILTTQIVSATNGTKVDTKSLSNGIYYLKINFQNQKMIVRKFIVDHTAFKKQ